MPEPAEHRGASQAGRWLRAGAAVTRQVRVPGCPQSARRGGRSPAAAPRTRGTEPRVAAPQPPPTPAREQLELWHPNRGHQPRAVTAPGAASSSQQLHTCYSATAEIPSLPRAQSTRCARSLVPSPYKRPSDELQAAPAPGPCTERGAGGMGSSAGNRLLSLFRCSARCFLQNLLKNCLWRVCLA